MPRKPSVLCQKNEDCEPNTTSPLIVEEAVEMKPVRVESPSTMRVEEAPKEPVISRVEPKVEEAVEMRPVKVESPSTMSVDEAPRAPVILRVEPKVEEAVEMKPVKIESPSTMSVEEAPREFPTSKVPETVEEPCEIKFVNVASPRSSTEKRVEEAWFAMVRSERLAVSELSSQRVKSE